MQAVGNGAPSNRLAVDHEVLLPDFARSLNNPRIALGPMITAAGEAHTGTVAFQAKPVLNPLPRRENTETLRLNPAGFCFLAVCAHARRLNQPPDIGAHLQTPNAFTTAALIPSRRFVRRV